MQAGEPGEVGRAARFDVDPSIVPILIIPTLQASTTHARGALPPSVPYAQACFNVARSALLVHALTTDPDLLLEATDDRLHQQQRRAVYPASLDLVGVLRERGIPAAISGAGPAVIAFAVGDPTSLVEGISALVGPGAGVRVLSVSARGVRRV
jgi:homoserine kinase